jgi:hypothetical protein
MRENWETEWEKLRNWESWETEERVEKLNKTYLRNWRESRETEERVEKLGEKLNEIVVKQNEINWETEWKSWGSINERTEKLNETIEKFKKWEIWEIEWEKWRTRKIWKTGNLLWFCMTELSQDLKLCIVHKGEGGSFAVIR